MKRIIVSTTLIGLLATAPAFAQSTTPTAPRASAATPAQKVDALVNMPVYSSDNKNLGTVAAVTRDSAGKVAKIDTDIGGFLGLGQHRISLAPAQFTIGSDKVMLLITAEQAKALPQVVTK